MPTAQVRISAEEQRLLRALSVGQNVRLPSAHRLRLELLGLLHDGPNGPRLTPLGRRPTKVERMVEEVQRRPEELWSKVGDGVDQEGGISWG
jgi:hypothetical protein